MSHRQFRLMVLNLKSILTLIENVNTFFRSKSFSTFMSYSNVLLLELPNKLKLTLTALKEWNIKVSKQFLKRFT